LPWKKWGVRLLEK